MRRPVFVLFLGFVCLGGMAVQSAPFTKAQLCQLIGNAEAADNGRSRQDLEGVTAHVTLRPPGQNWRIAVAEVTDPASQPLMQARVMPPCITIEARLLRRDAGGEVVAIQVLGPDLTEVTATEPQNPPVPAFKHNAHQPGTALLAHVDTGINYLLPGLRPHIATDRDGGLVGYDFWDGDERPFDVDPRRNPFFPQHHGTTVFSVLAREAPKAGIAVYRFPANEMCRFADLVEHMASHGVRVANMSMGSRKASDWRCFEDAAKRNPQILFIVSSGNDGNDIDKTPIYPASLTLRNMLVVTSSDSFGRLGRGSNMGAMSVDVMVPAERIEVLDHRGARAVTGGTSYAAPRVAALATRFLMANPDADTQGIIAFILSRTISTQGVPLAHGWIPDPTDDFGF